MGGSFHDDDFSINERPHAEGFVDASKRGRQANLGRRARMTCFGSAAEIGNDIFSRELIEIFGANHAQGSVKYLENGQLKETRVHGEFLIIMIQEHDLIFLERIQLVAIL